MNPILCPVRNGLHYTRAAMKSFLVQDVGDIEVLFIDNASTDGTTPWLNTQDCWKIHNSVPKGVAASWNQGLRWLFANGAYHVLVVNNDVVLRPDTYRWLLTDNGDFVTAVGNNDPKCVETFEDPDPAKNRRHPDFSCFLIRRECFEKAGPFDEDFQGAYAEDLLYHYRMHQAGIDAHCIDLPFYHVLGGTLKEASPEEQQRITAQADANRRLFYEKTGVRVGSQEYYALFGPEVEAAWLKGAGTDPAVPVP